MRSKTAPIDIPSYPSGQALLEEQAGKIFLQLEQKTFAEVGYMFGLDRYFSTEASIRSAVMRAFNLVLDNPGKYDILPEKVGYIQGVVSSRGIKKRDPETLREQQEIEKADIAGLVTGSRDLAARLVRKKLDHLDNNPKALKEMSLKELIGALHILFDKGQIIAGAATEHIAVLSSVDAQIDPKEAMAAIMKMRDEMQERK